MFTHEYIEQTPGAGFGRMILLLIVLLLSRLQPKNVIGQSAVGKQSQKHYAPGILGSSSQMLLLLLLLAFASPSRRGLRLHFGHSAKQCGGQGGKLNLLLSISQSNCQKWEESVF